MTFLDLGNAKIENNILGLLKKSNVIKFRCIPIKKTGKFVSVAIFDPSIVEIKEVCLDHINLLIKNKSEKTSINLSKKHLSYYLKNFSHMSVVDRESILKMIKTSSH